MTIRNIDRADGVGLIVTEYLQGKTLAQELPKTSKERDGVSEIPHGFPRGISQL